MGESPGYGEEVVVHLGHWSLEPPDGGRAPGGEGRQHREASPPYKADKNENDREKREQRNDNGSLNEHRGALRGTQHWLLCHMGLY